MSTSHQSRRPFAAQRRIAGPQTPVELAKPQELKPLNGASLRCFHEIVTPARPHPAPRLGCKKRTEVPPSPASFTAPARETTPSRRTPSSHGAKHYLSLYCKLGGQVKGKTVSFLATDRNHESQGLWTMCVTGYPRGKPLILDPRMTTLADADVPRVDKPTSKPAEGPKLRFSTTLNAPPAPSIIRCKLILCRYLRVFGGPAHTARVAERVFWRPSFHQCTRVRICLVTEVITC